MKSRAADRNVVFAVAIAALAFVCSANGQEPERREPLTRFIPEYRHRQQAETLEALTTKLGPAASGLDALYDLSRLLSDPCDQIHWLCTKTEQPEAFGTDEQTRNTAANLGEILARLHDAEDVSSRCAEDLDKLLRQLRKIAEPPRPWDLTEPKLLIEQWRAFAAANDTSELSADRKLVLLSRGVPASELRLSRSDAWDQPRQVIEELARSATLPAMWQLLQLERELSGGERESSNWADLTFPVDDTFRIAHGLLDRAMGIDTRDRSGAAGAADEAAEWAALAARLEANAYWTWAALARTLEAGNRDEPSAAAQQAATQWNNVREVSAALEHEPWPGVANDDQAWLARLSQPEVVDVPGILPLRNDFRSAARAERASHEQAFLRARENNNAGEAFRSIQLAKAADAGLTRRGFQPVELAALAEELKFKKRGEVAGVNVFALLEIITIQRGDHAEYYGVVLHAKDWAWGVDYEWEVAGPRDSPALLAKDALDFSKQYNDCRILIAPDGGLDREWFAYEKQTLLERTSQPTTGWLYYLPSAAALDDNAWTLDETLRTWNRAANRAGGKTIGYYSVGGTPRELGKISHRAPSLPLHALSFGAYPEELAVRSAQSFKQRKQQADAPLEALLVLTSRAP
jgi:hypothetical protein